MRDIRLNDAPPRFCSSRCQLLDKDVQSKMQETMFDRIGTRHALQNKEICEKAKEQRHKTNLEKYGVEEAFSAKCVQEKKE